MRDDNREAAGPPASLDFSDSGLALEDKPRRRAVRSIGRVVFARGVQYRLLCAPACTFTMEEKTQPVIVVGINGQQNRAHGDRVIFGYAGVTQEQQMILADAYNSHACAASYAKATSQSAPPPNEQVNRALSRRFKQYEEMYRSSVVGKARGNWHRAFLSRKAATDPEHPDGKNAADLLNALEFADLRRCVAGSCFMTDRQLLVHRKAMDLDERFLVSHRAFLALRASALLPNLSSEGEDVYSGDETDRRLLDDILVWESLQSAPPPVGVGALCTPLGFGRLPHEDSSNRTMYIDLHYPYDEMLREVSTIATVPGDMFHVSWFDISASGDGSSLRERAKLTLRQICVVAPAAGTRAALARFLAEYRSGAWSIQEESVAFRDSVDYSGGVYLNDSRAVSRDPVLQLKTRFERDGTSRSPHQPVQVFTSGLFARRVCTVRSIDSQITEPPFAIPALDNRLSPYRTELNMAYSMERSMGELDVTVTVDDLVVLGLESREAQAAATIRVLGCPVLTRDKKIAIEPVSSKMLRETAGKRGIADYAGNVISASRVDAFHLFASLSDLDASDVHMMLTDPQDACFFVPGTRFERREKVQDSALGTPIKTPDGETGPSLADRAQLATAAVLGFGQTEEGPMPPYEQDFLRDHVRKMSDGCQALTAWFHSEPASSEPTWMQGFGDSAGGLSSYATRAFCAAWVFSSHMNGIPATIALERLHAKYWDELRRIDGVIAVAARMRDDEGGEAPAEVIAAALKSDALSRGVSIFLSDDHDILRPHADLRFSATPLSYAYEYYSAEVPLRVVFSLPKRARSLSTLRSALEKIEDVHTSFRVYTSSAYSMLGIPAGRVQDNVRVFDSFGADA